MVGEGRGCEIVLSDSAFRVEIVKVLGFRRVTHSSERAIFHFYFLWQDSQQQHSTIDLFKDTRRV